ncbi:glycosyltransferase family 4 protein [Sphaerospermopsis kisseleviana CS-549]|uniref:Glycosyltransferase family 4 protein n=1 Tax=Sphaerospermopsis kisseleviana CS-549 TaxID=3021783 RepID=A0ABT4ZWA7_9CYAN|nr:glycosyltransferase family 4 protein [Sphaerospermopsis kisseleviana]MDB9443698.1 glycosyltransferase family 4 protein [Sphaerospermopsis kisseleviana CS-549]BAZ83343.1 group 1 glycosyl transferase [Sphaerospermopsis kisseleviana NIES-73]
MMKLLLVTFSVDLGSTTFEKRFINLFQNQPELDLKTFRFAPITRNSHPRSIFTLDYASLLFSRFRDSINLYQVINQANKEQRKVLFQGVSPALFGYIATGNNRSYLVTDWTRKLYEQIWKSSVSPGWLTQIHKKVLNSQKAVLGLTDAVLEQIARDYNVPDNKLKKAKLPLCFDLKLFTPSSDRGDQEIRILFVGGDFQRKGGDLLLRWFKENYEPCLKMTMVTGFSVQKHPGITVERNVEYGQNKHIELYKSHDIFVLPTHYDAYPSVLGEAACAGLAILTTKNALGASEVIRDGENGYICDSPGSLFKKLKLLIKDRDLLAIMKQNSRKLMEREFSDEVVLSEYIRYIFE